MNNDAIRRSVSALCLLLLLAAAPALFAQPGPPDNRVPVIIGFQNQPGPGDEAGLRAMGGNVKHRYTIIPAIAARLPQAAIDALRGNPAITVVEPDVTVYALSDAEYSNTWGVSKIGARLVHDDAAHNEGAGVNVCDIDTGIDTNHDDLKLNFKGGYDFVNDKLTPEDDNGHGTHTAGTIGALLNGVGVVGVAPSVNLYAYKVLNSAGSGSFSDVIAAVQACAKLVPSGPTVSNNSYGSSGDPGTLVEQAFVNAYNAGVLHVASAGNSGNSAGTGDNVGYPAKYDSVIAVAATDSANNRAYFSSTGPKVELAAPGVSIYSTYLNGGYASMNGTSMASPHVAGVAALVFRCIGLADLNNDGSVDNLDVRLRMQQTAQDLGTAGRDTKFGFGLVRADLAALNCGSAPPPTPDTPPAAPTNLRSSSVTKNSITLSWNDNSSNETRFQLERCLGDACQSFTFDPNVTTYRDSGLARRTTYEYKVNASNGGGTSDWSNTLSVKTK